jgi:orotate phosphoribosyltransferase
MSEPVFLGPMYQYPSHLRPALNKEERYRTLERCTELLSHYEFDTLAFSGVSGAAVGFVLAHLLDKEVIIVRKPDERRRAGQHYNVEGYIKAKRYIIVDDIVASGTTAARVIRGVRVVAPTAELVGILTYDNRAKIITHDPFAEFPTTWNDVQRCVQLMDRAEAEGKPPEG